jgi:hypothetical protein
MKADTEPRILSRQRDRLLATGLVHHQAGGGQDPVAMRADHRLIDGLGSAKVVCIDHQAPAQLI